MSRAGIEPALSRCMVRIETILIVSFFFAVQSAIKAFLLPFILFYFIYSTSNPSSDDGYSSIPTAR